MTTAAGPARAVVIGGSMAGLLAARALTDTHEEVLVVDRDTLPTTPVHRVGVPQARHAHWLLARGLEVLESFFPGLSAELAAMGATLADPQRDGMWVFDGRPARRAPSDLACLTMSRTLLESCVRTRVAALPGVRILPRHEVVGLLPSPDGRRISGVRALRRGSPEPGLEVRADLVVDASGRASRTPLWLRELGHRPPREDRVRVSVTYATRHYRGEQHRLPGVLAIGRHVTPERPRGAALYFEEGDRWSLTLAGVLSDEPPVAADAFTAFACSLGDPCIRRVVVNAEPLDDPVRMRFPETVRRRYERLPRPPEGLVVIGDAMCSTNPTLSHGMSVAALQAKALHDCLGEGAARLPRRFYRRAARVLTVPWIATRTSDVLPYESGCRRSPFLWLADLARSALSAAMERDATVTRACLRVAHLVTGLGPLFSPRVLIRVLPSVLRLLPAQMPWGRARPAAPPERSGMPGPRHASDHDHAPERGRSPGPVPVVPTPSDCSSARPWRKLPLPGTLAQSAIDDPVLRAAYAACGRFCKAANPTEYALMRLMPTALRPACWALWTALSVPDNIIDSTDGTPAERAARMRAWTRDLEEELRGATSSDPYRRAIVDTFWRWQLDPRDLHVSYAAIEADAAGRQSVAWEDWSARVQHSNVTWASQCLTLLNRAGLSTLVRPQHHRDLARFLDGVYLTDTLVDLAADLDRGVLQLPTEAVEQFSVEPASLLQRCWTPHTKALIKHLVARARHQLEPPALTALHPGTTILLRAVSNLFLARLRAVERAGPRLLHTSPDLGPLTRTRILATARAQAAVAWKLAPLDVPRTPTRLPAQTAMILPQPAARAGTAGPRPHPSGVRPPLIEASHMPRHVAVIMDGNGRWATERGLPRHEGHRAGRTALCDVVHGALEIGLQYLTVYAFSSENWQRSPTEIANLFELAAEGTGDFEADGVRLRWAGSPEGLPQDLVDALQRAEHESMDESALTLTICLNYGGRAELADAAAGLARAAVAGEVDPNHVSEHLLARYLPYPDTPDVDLLWRTGGDRRISNFLPWQTTYAELHFTDIYWPDVDRRDLWQTMLSYGCRERRYGTVPAAPRPPALTGPGGDPAAAER
ncbi:polyprenyl diphosphate synthase [Streptomyces sp. NRRL B-1677]|uniref:polyprenyl diphosphate synthase n=1 Tax=Streptomyces sp. NRRL B-1677 TaxID=2682966 RepID=UPI001E513433|nr:polyprenyl diphosphate synthase [Streptomyces sp. NRRL B-1677]